MNPKITIIAAIDKNNGIGYNNKLLCKLPIDMQYFKEVTIGSNVIMGRKTFDSLPNGVLKQRTNIILSKTAYNITKGYTARNIAQAINVCDSSKPIYVIGGANIYSQFMPICNHMLITHIDFSFKSDAYFPKIDYKDWAIDNIVAYYDNKYFCKRILYIKKNNQNDRIN